MKTKYTGDKVVSFHVRMAKEMKDKLDLAAKNLGVDVSTVVRLVLKQAFESGGIKVSIGDQSNTIGTATNSTITQTIGK